MRFNPKARVGTSQIEDRTGGGGGGFGTGSPLGGGGGGLGGGGIRMGGGIGGVVALIVIVVVFLLQSGVLGGGSSGGQSSTGQSSGNFEECNGSQADSDRDCRLQFITASVQDYWSKAYPQQTGRQYAEIKTVPFSGSVQTDGCGSATSDTGPFYCPVDQRVYLDLSFFDGLLEQLGGKDTAFTEAYVVAHEYGHHIENQVGVLSKVRTQTGPNSDSVKLETMADCLAGAWAKNATTTVDDNGETLITELTQQDIKEGIAAAKVVGDDSIQRRSGGRVNPEQWTHGSSQQRIDAFNVGLKAGTIKACNFFDASNGNYPAVG